MHESERTLFTHARSSLRWGLMLVAAISLLGVSRVHAWENPSSAPEDDPRVISALNLETRTLGGKQFWTDEFIHLDWRIQRHVMSDHYRLLDDRNVRRAWGSYEQCEAEFQRLKVEENIPPLSRQVILVLHGLVRSRESMEGMCEYLRQNTEWSVLNVSYASTREKLADHARALRRIIERLDGVEEIHFVAHSMGNLVIRHYMADCTNPASGEMPDPRIRRMVMLGPPNNGAEMALRFRNNLVFQTVWGESGRELAADWTELGRRLAVPCCEFAVIAGGKNNDTGFNPLIAGDDDFVVAVEETRLAGAHDFIVVPVPHGTIMSHRDVQEYTLRFLRDGYFISEKARQRIPVDAATVEAGSLPPAHE